jgi:hypothetical protein
VPAYVDEEGVSVIAERAVYCLLYITEAYNGMLGMLTPFWHPELSEGVSVVVVLHAGVYCYYVRLESVTGHTPRCMAVVGAVLTGNMRVPLSSESSFDYYDTAVPTCMVVGPTPISMLQLKNAYDASAVPTVSMSHHQHITLPELQAAIKAAKASLSRAEKKLMLRTLGFVVQQLTRLGVNSRPTFVTFIMYVMLAPSFARDLLINVLALAEDAADLVEWLKQEGQASKQLQGLYRDDLSAVFEMAVLVNRGDGDVDWATELKNRTEPTTVPISSDTVYQLSCDIFNDAKVTVGSPVPLAWDDYWAERWARMPGGTAVSQYEEDVAVRKSLPLALRNKAAWFSASSMRLHADWAARTPKIFASSSTKYEWGKVRALYGCDVTSFLHADYGFNRCEEYLPAYFPVGSRSSASHVAKLTDKMRHGVPLCYDYSDFNSQHSTASMAAVLRAWHDVFSAGLEPEQVTSVRWVIESLSDVSARFNALQSTHRLNGTLLSGWRLTSFVNTVLNRVYLVDAGLLNRTFTALHNGDDVYATAPTVADALKLCSDAATRGIRAQITKTNIGTIGEFLRVNTRAKSASGAQYLTRSVSTLVHGRIDTTAPNDLLALLHAHDTRRDGAILRGGNPAIISAAVNRSKAFALKLFDAKPEVQQALNDLHPIQGGCNDQAALATHRLAATTITELDDRDIEDAAGLVASGVTEYIQHIKERFNLHNAHIGMKKTVNNMLRAVMTKFRSYELVIEDRNAVVACRRLYKAHHKTSHTAVIAQLRTLGLAAMTSATLYDPAVLAIVTNCENPLLMASSIL